MLNSTGGLGKLEHTSSRAITCTLYLTPQVRLVRVQPRPVLSQEELTPWVLWATTLYDSAPWVRSQEMAAVLSEQSIVTSTLVGTQGTAKRTEFYLLYCVYLYDLSSGIVIFRWWLLKGNLLKASLAKIINFKISTTKQKTAFLITLAEKSEESVGRSTSNGFRCTSYYYFPARALIVPRGCD